MEDHHLGSYLDGINVALAHNDRVFEIKSHGPTFSLEETLGSNAGASPRTDRLGASVV